MTEHAKHLPRLSEERGGGEVRELTLDPAPA